MKDLAPVSIDSSTLSRFITKTKRTQYLIWTIMFFVVVLIILAGLELVKYEQTICGLFLALTALIMLHLWLIFIFGFYYNSSAILKALVIYAGILLLYLFLFSAFYVLHISADKTNRTVFRNTTHIVWTAILCAILLFFTYAASSNSRSQEVKAMDVARQEFFKKLLIQASFVICSAPPIPHEKEE